MIFIKFLPLERRERSTFSFRKRKSWTYPFQKDFLQKSSRQTKNLSYLRKNENFTRLGFYAQKCFSHFGKMPNGIFFFLC
jgi:hypothetical protein